MPNLTPKQADEVLKLGRKIREEDRLRHDAMRQQAREVDARCDRDDAKDVENPPYYRAFAIEPLDFIEANDLGYLPGTVVKYAARAGRKPGESTLKDARKCLTFAKRWVAKLEREAASLAPADLRKMPREQRQAILAAAAENATAAYATGGSLRDFEAFGDGDIYDTHGQQGSVLNASIDLAAVAQACTAPKAG